MGILEQMSLKGKAIFVTGGARGIGKSVAEAFCQAGADVAIVDLDLETAKETAEQLRRDTGSDTRAYGADVTDPETARRTLLSLCETVGMRMRRDGQRGMCVTVHLRTAQFRDFSHQRMLPSATNITAELYGGACRALEEAWDPPQPLRQIGVQVTQLRQDGGYRQYSLFDRAGCERLEKLDAAVDALRERYGEDSVFRARFLGQPEAHMAGGLSRHRRTGVTKQV